MGAAAAKGKIGEFWREEESSHPEHNFQNPDAFKRRREGFQVPPPPLRTYMSVKNLFKGEECLGSLESQGEGRVVAKLYAPVELGAYLLSSLLLSEDTWHASCPTFLLQQKQKDKK